MSCGHRSQVDTPVPRISRRVAIVFPSSGIFVLTGARETGIVTVWERGTQAGRLRHSRLTGLIAGVETFPPGARNAGRNRFADMAKPLKRLTTEALIARIRRLRSVPGTSFTAIAQELNADGIVSQKGTAWTSHDVGTFVSRHVSKDDDVTSSLELPSPPLSAPEFLEDIPDTITLELTPAALAALGGERQTIVAEVRDFSTDSTIHLDTEFVDEDTTVVEEPRRSDAVPAGVDVEDVKALLASFKSGELREMLQWFRAQQRTGPAPAAGAVTGKPSFPGPTKSVTLALSAPPVTGALKKMAADGPRAGSNLSQLVEILLWQYLGSPSSLPAKGSGSPP